MKKTINFLIAFVLVCFTFCTSIFAKVAYNPTNEFFVNDFANVLSSSTEQQVQSIAVKTQEATNAQIVVVTVPSLDGGDIETYSNELFNSWEIGNKEKDNGILLLISTGDRKVRIEVGYGLEGAINDAKAGRILDDVALPHMKDGDYDTAVKNVVNELQGIIYNEYGVEGGFDNYKEDDTMEFIGTLVSIGVLLFFIFLRVFLASKGIFIFGGHGGRKRWLWWRFFWRRWRFLWRRWLFRWRRRIPWLLKHKLCVDMWGCPRIYSVCCALTIRLLEPCTGTASMRLLRFFLT
ncbi:MAG: TPM domain-containing protein, partial [Clostridia bacterium]|nr:TPM domain-containing protein [Clostridia bacterium]